MSSRGKFDPKVNFPDPSIIEMRSQLLFLLLIITCTQAQQKLVRLSSVVIRSSFIDNHSSLYIHIHASTNPYQNVTVSMKDLENRNPSAGVGTPYISFFPNKIQYLYYIYDKFRADGLVKMLAGEFGNQTEADLKFWFLRPCVHLHT